MAPSLWVWIGFVGFVLVALALDLGIWHRDPHVIGVREAMRWTVFWVVLALVFAALLAWRAGTQAALTFVTGYAIEQALSVDNVFVTALILTSFGIPAAYQHRVLFWGILGAMVARGGFIALGVVLFHRFDWVQYVLGALLLVTAVRIPRQRDERVSGGLTGGESLIVRAMTRLFPVSPTLAGGRLVTRDPGRAGRWAATPLLLALVCVEASDIAFATDSIPALFAITRDPFLIFTATVFALLGLRSLYFVVVAAMRSLRTFRLALAVIVALVGLKMLLASIVTVPAWAVLAVVVGVLLAARLLDPARKASAPGG